MYYLSQGVQVPEAHISKGLVTVTRSSDGGEFDWQDVLEGMINVRVSAWPPGDAFIRVRYRNYWYYIAESDNNSKSTFSLLMQLFSLQAGGDKTGGPILTIPVS